MDIASVRDVLSSLEKHCVLLVATGGGLLVCGLLGTSDLRIGPVTLPRRGSTFAVSIVATLVVALAARLAYVLQVICASLPQQLRDDALGVAHWSPWFLNPFSDFGPSMTSQLAACCGPVLAGSLGATLVIIVDAQSNSSRSQRFVYLAFVPMLLVAAVSFFHTILVVCPDSAIHRLVCLSASFFVTLVAVGRALGAKLHYGFR